MDRWMDGWVDGWMDGWMNGSNTPMKEFFFSVYYTPGYILDCLQCTTLKMFEITFSKPPSRNSPGV